MLVAVALPARPRVRHDVPVLHLELTFEQIGVRLVADRDEHACERDVGRLAGLAVLDLEPMSRRWRRLAPSSSLVIPLDLDRAFLFFREQAVDQDRSRRGTCRDDGRR